MALVKSSIADIWTLLESVPDPEIPVISVVDLGIIRDVSWEQDVLHVTITPTYSGCPATAVIKLSVQNALLDHGIESVKLIDQISPPWTTDWISETGRDKLKAYGIAPPNNDISCAAMLTMAGQDFGIVECPRCKSSNTECVSQFGSTPCKASYRCKDCLEPFDYFKKF